MSLPGSVLFLINVSKVLPSQTFKSSFIGCIVQHQKYSQYFVITVDFK